jgi:acetyl esterase/lipase
VDARNRELAGIGPDFLDIAAARRSLPDLGMELPPGFVETKTQICGVTVWRLGVPVHASGPLIVYCHGGGFVAGGLASHRALVAWLADRAQGQVWFVDYTLAPEGRFPLQIDQAATVLQAALGGEAGGAARQVFIAGDSAGACLAVGAMVRARVMGLAQPTAAILLCGMFDIDPASSVFANANPRIREMVRAYLGQAAVSDRLANPMVADLAGLPPMLLQTGTADGCRPDVERFHQRAIAAQVEVTLSVWPDMFHVWQRFAPLLPEAVTALTEAGAFIAAHLR